MRGGQNYISEIDSLNLTLNLLDCLRIFERKKYAKHIFNY